MTEETLFHETLSRPRAERAAFLEKTCAGQPDLRAAVEARLAAHEAPLDFPPTAEPDPSNPRLRQGHGLVVTSGQCSAACPGLVLAGRYTLTHKLGEGGMGEVWVANQTEPVKRLVAVKLVRATQPGPAVLARFEAERQALALMDHPSIARVLDGGLAPDGRPFFAMELVDGLPLTRFCDEHRLTPRQRLELFVPVCRAVQHAHHKGVVHRDLKPANILVTVLDGRPVPKVIDFGVAKAVAGKLTDEALSTQLGAVVGTLEYMAPEQAGLSDLAGQDIDTRADIYSLGVVLYELLTGLRPFDVSRLREAGLAELCRALQEEPPRPSARLSSDAELPSLAALRQTEPGRLAALLRGELDWVVMRCLEKQRERRYETASALARDVERYLADEPVEARPPSLGYRLGKLFRRHRGPALAAALVVLALVGGVAGTTFGLVRAERARAEEAAQRQLAQEKEQEALHEKEKAVKAAQAEAAALAQTRRRLGQIEKGVTLLASLLQGINPRNEARGGPTLYEQLRQRAAKAAEQLDGDAVGDADTVAQLQVMLGDTLRELGDVDRAVAVLEKASTTLERNLGTDHPETLAARSSLGVTYQAAGKVGLALPLFERILKAREGILGKDDLAILVARNNLAGAYQAAGKPDLAVPLLEATLKATESRLGEDNPSTWAARHNLATAYAAWGKPDRALPLLVATLKATESRLGEDHADTLLARSSLARVYQDAGKWELALPLSERNLAVLEAKLGEDHPHTLTARNNLAIAYQTSGKPERALPLLERTLKAREGRLPDDHPDTLTSYFNLAGVYMTLGRLNDARSLLEKALRLRKARHGPDHPDTVVIQRNLEFVQNLTSAEDRYRERLARLGPDHLDTLLARRDLAQLYLATSRLDEAESTLAEVIEGLSGRADDDTIRVFTVGLLRKCLAARERTMPDSWLTFQTRSLLGGALLGLKKYAEAEALLLEGYEGMKRREKGIPAAGKIRLAEAARRLVRLSEATGKKEDAARWRQALEAAQGKPEKKP